MDINVYANKALKDYFNILSTKGYLPDKDTDNVLIYVYINDILNKYDKYITEEEFGIILDLLKCLNKQTCFLTNVIPNKHIASVNNYLLATPIKISEKDIIRITQDVKLRLVDGVIE